MLKYLFAFSEKIHFDVRRFHINYGIIKMSKFAIKVTHFVDFGRTEIKTS